MSVVSPTFVFVHGSHAGSFGFAPLQRELALRGHRSLAVDLPGHGFGASFPLAYQSPQDAEALGKAPSNLAGATAAEAVAHVVDVVRRVREHGPVILVGHSRGGLTITGVGNAVPDLLDRIVYVSAWCCVDATPEEYMRGPEYATSALGGTAAALAADPAEIGALRLNWRTADPELLAALKKATLADGTEDEFLAVLGTLQPDEGLDTGGGKVRAERWGAIPRTYVRLTRDESIPVALQDRFIREADALTPANPFAVESLDTSHLGFLVHPAGAADVLARMV